MTAGVSFAQFPGMAVEKVDVAKLRAAIAKSDAEIADAKRNARSATWIKRAEVLLDANAKPVNGIYAGMPVTMLTQMFGNVAPQQVDLGGVAYDVYAYDNLKAYVRSGSAEVEFYIATTIVDADALDKAYEAYDKAYSLDSKAKSKVGDGLENVRLRSVEEAGAQYSLADYAAAAKSFRRAYKASAHPASSVIDTLSLYYAGMTGVFGADYANALEAIDKAIDLGFEADGDVYRMKFLALYNLDRKEESLEVLKGAIARFSGNEDLIDMAMRYYAENDGDPTSMIPLVEEAIAQNPTNVSLYQGLARVYDKLGQHDNAITAIKKAAELAPNDFLSNYLEGYFIIKKGDAMNAELGNMTITSRTQYQQAFDAVMATFASALVPLERAYELDPSEGATVELLKNLTFRLREDEAMNAKYEKYNAILESMD